MLLILAMVLGAVCLSASAAELSAEDALGYLDSYTDNMAADADFDSAVVRESVGSYATILSLLPPIIAIALALITKELYSSLFVGILIFLVLLVSLAMMFAVLTFLRLKQKNA